MSLRTRKFITAYAQHGNGARAVREAGYNSPRSELQSAIATEYLKKPVVNNRVQELLAGMNITQERILEIHTRNMLQTDNLNVSQKAVETFEHMLGMHAPREGTGGTVNVSINIE
jgi:phage terminase small subunit